MHARKKIHSEERATRKRSNEYVDEKNKVNAARQHDSINGMFFKESQRSFPFKWRL